MSKERRFKTRIISKHDSEANWSLANNFIPFAGEIIIYDPDELHEVPRVKIGDGQTTVKDLKFINSGLEDLVQEIQDDLDGLISCGTADPNTSITSKFYFKYSE